MTPTEVTTILRQFNEWRRGDETVEQPDPREIGEAIDAAVEMIERLDRLIQQDPVGWFARIDGDGPLMECKHADFETAHARMMTSAEREREACAAICDELESFWSAEKDVALLNGDVALSNATSGEPRAARALAAAIRARGDA